MSELKIRRDFCGDDNLTLKPQRFFFHIQPFVCSRNLSKFCYQRGNLTLNKRNIAFSIKQKTVAEAKSAVEITDFVYI